MPPPTINSQPVEHVNPNELFQVISDAASQDLQRVHYATSRLKELLQLFGSYEGLQEIAAQKELPLPIRQQAIIQFKNSALNHWKSRKLLSDEHRSRIRARSLSFAYEGDDLIAGVNEVIVAKIARSDYPGTWPNVITDILCVIESNLQSRYQSLSADAQTTLVLRRSLRLLNAILKELSTMRMLPGIRAMGEVVQNLHMVIYSYYSKISSAFATLNPSTAGSPKAVQDILLCHLVFKALVTMSVWLWNKTEKMTPMESDISRAWLEKLFQNSAVQLKTLTEIRINLILVLRASESQPDANSRLCVDQLTRHVRLFGKFFRRLQQLDPKRFIAFPMCAELVLYYWDKVVQATDGPPELIADNNEAVFPVRFLVQGLVLFKESLSHWTPVRKNGSPNEQTLSKEFVEGAVMRLVTRFILLNSSDLEAWAVDPEEWLNTEDRENDQWEYQLRPCGERVLLTLAQQYHQYTVPLLEEQLRQVSIQTAVDLPSVIQKEAVYCAIGRCAARMKDVIPFTQWLESMLLPEARDPNPNFPIVKRRIAWLIGKWVSDMCSPANDPKIWEVLSHLLHDRSPGTDAAVRLTAAAALGECVDTNDFNPDVFAPFLQAAVTDLVHILAECETLESKRRVAKSLRIVIEQAGYRIVPFITTIAEPIPRLWNTAGTNLATTDWLLKASLLTVVTTLINAAKEQSLSLGVIVIPLVLESLSPGTQVHLGKDGLVLWQAALHNTITIENRNGVPALLDLFPLAVELLSENLDLLGKVTAIHESYFLLDGPLVLKGFATNLFTAFRQALGHLVVTDVNSVDMLFALGLLIQLTPSSLWGEALHTSGLFPHLINTLIEEKKATSVLTATVLVFARISITDAQAFLQLVSLGAQILTKAEAHLYDVIVDQWCWRLDNMSEQRYRKLTAMGIAALVGTGRVEILARLPTDVFALWTDVFAEIQESKRNQESDGSLTTELIMYWERDDLPTSYFKETDGTPEYDRRRFVYDADPVRTIELRAYIGAMLQKAESLCGSQNFESVYLSKADPLIFGQLQDALRKPYGHDISAGNGGF